MNPDAHQVTTAFVWAFGAGIAAWLLTIPLRRRSTGLALLSVVLIGSSASIGAMVGSFRAMLVSTGELLLTIAITVMAGLLAATAAALTTRRLVRDREVLRQAMLEIEQGRVPTADGPKLSAELETLRTQLADTGRSLTESRDRERAVETARRELVAFLSHDLRTPLAGLRAMSESLEDGVTDSPDRYYKQIRVEVERLNTMVDDLFDLSRIQSGTLALKSETVELSDVLSDCLAALTPLAQARRVRLRGHSEGAATITGDGHELSRAMTNLVGNAIRHTRPDGEIDVSVSRRPDAPMAEVVVRDECGGIPSQDLGRVFDAGFRGASARTPSRDEDGGAGFGLAITRGIVEAHRGIVEVRNVEAGCAFTVRLPVAAGTAARSARPGDNPKPRQLRVDRTPDVSER